MKRGKWRGLRGGGCVGRLEVPLRNMYEASVMEKM